MVGFASAATTPALVAASAALKVLNTSSFLTSLIVLLPFVVQTVEVQAVELQESPARIASTGCFSTPSCLEATSVVPARLSALIDRGHLSTTRSVMGVLQHSSTIP